MRLITAVVGVPPHRLRGMLPLLLLLCLAPVAVLTDDLLPPDQMCVQAVFMGYNYLSFAERNASAPHTEGADFCRNELKAISIYAAGKVICAASDDSKDFAPIVALLQEHCHKWGNGAELRPVPDLVANSSVDELRESLRSLEWQEIPRGQMVDEVVLLSNAYYSRCFQTIFSWRYTMWAHKRNGRTQYEFWGVVMLVAAAAQLFRRFLRDRLYRALRSFRKAFSFSVFQSALDFIDRWTPESLTYERVPGVVATEKDSRSCFRFKFTPVGETVAIWVYWILSIIFNFFNYRFYDQSIYFPEMPHQVARYAADRTGILSYANLPILWLFSGRNNIFMWATGWKFPTFIRFHLHVAWIATLEAIAHSVLYTVLTLDSGVFWEWLKTDWFFLGVVATFVMTLLLIVSTPVWLRERYYELFIDSHIISSLAVIIGLFVHTSVFDHEYDWYLWVPAILWLLDRSLRLIRILAFNFGFRNGRIQCTKTTAIYDRESNIITLEIVPGPNIVPPKPGQYYFLYQPFSIRGYENHPMTLGTWRRHSNVSASEEEVYPLTPTTTSSAEQEEDGETAALSSSSQPLLSSAASSASSSVTNLATPSSPTSPSKSSAKTPTTLTFWIRPYDGWTRRLRDQCIRHDAQAHPSSGRTRTRTRTARLHPLVLLEGPYGATHALGSYDATILIAGGSGISAAVPYLQEEHAKQQRASPRPRPGGEEDVEEGGGSDGAGRARMQLVWAVREEAFMREVVERELGAGLAQGAFGAALFCTGDAARAERVGGVEIQAGRPNVRAVIGEAAQGVVAAKARRQPGKRGRIAVLLCGPPAMARGVEAAVRSAAEEFDCWVDYFDEVFSW